MAFSRPPSWKGAELSEHLGPRPLPSGLALPTLSLGQQRVILFGPSVQNPVGPANAWPWA